MALYCYSIPTEVPRGISIRDANEILPERTLFFDRNGSVAVFSDWFRYELQRRNAGTWIDTDVYMISPLDQTRPYLFGRQDDEIINNAIFRVPAESPLLLALIALFESTRIPRWLPTRDKFRAHLRFWLSGKSQIGQLPWGTTGPQALTSLARHCNLDGHALPQNAFYPVPWQNARWILEPGVDISDFVSADTVAVHLWNECIKDFKNNAPPRGSFLERLHQDGCAS